MSRQKLNFEEIVEVECSVIFKLAHSVVVLEVFDVVDSPLEPVKTLLE